MEEKAAKEAAKAQRRVALEAKKAAKQKNTLLNHFAVAKTTVRSRPALPSKLQTDIANAVLHEMTCVLSAIKQHVKPSADVSQKLKAEDGEKFASEAGGSPPKKQCLAQARKPCQAIEHAVVRTPCLSMAASNSDLREQGGKAGAKAAAASRSVLDMLARGHAHVADRAAPMPAADSPAPAPATAPQHSRHSAARHAAQPSRQEAGRARAAAAAAAEGSQSQSDADLALRPKRLFSSQTADGGLIGDNGGAAQPRQTSGSQASGDSEPAADGQQQARRHARDSEPGRKAMSRKLLACDGDVRGRPGGHSPDDVVDLITPPALAEPGGGRDGPRPIVLSSLSSSSCSEQRADMPATPAGSPDVQAYGLAAAATASSRLLPVPARGGDTAAGTLPSAAVQLARGQISVVTRQHDTQQTNRAAPNSPAGISSDAARTRVGTLDMTRVNGARWLSDIASPYSDIVIDLDTPSTGPISVRTPAISSRAGRKADHV